MNTSRPNPYVGPRAFLPEETLYGRDRELHMLLAQLISEQVVLLHSPSGAGKTSLIHAGLIPLLREEKFHILPVARVNLEPEAELSRTPGFNRYVFSVIASLEEGLSTEERRPLASLASLTLDTYLSERPRPAEAPRSDMLIFDQFEEILTIASTDREGKQAFFAQLGAALRNSSRWALFAMREDYLGAIAPYVRPIPNRFEVTFRLDLLGVEPALQAIQRPAREARVDFTDEAAQKLVDDLRRVQVQQPDGRLEAMLGPHIEPVQLQVVCYNLWETGAAETGRISPEDLQRIGSIDQSLAAYYANTLKKASETSGVDERLIRQWFESALITPEGVRNQVLRSQALHQAGVTEAVLSHLESAHLIRGETRAGKLWYELAHDRMIAPIRQDNTVWFGANLSLLQKQAALWVSQKRPEGLLLRGKELEKAGRESQSAQLNADERFFLDACRKLRQRERRDLFQRQMIAGALFLALILLGAAVFFGFTANAATRNAENQAAAAQTSEANAQAASTEAINNSNAAATAQVSAKRQANIARARELMAYSVEQRDKNLIASLLLGVEAYQTMDFDPTRNYLLGQFRAHPELRQYIFTNNDITSVTFSPDGKTLASGSYDGNIILWDIATSQPLGEPLIGHITGLTSVAFSPDGKTLASERYDGTIILWDMETRQPIGEPLKGHTNGVTSVVFSPDGKTLASGSHDGTIILWNVETHRPIGESLKGSVSSVAFSPDGQVLASGSDDTIILWNVATHRPIGEPLKGHTNGVTSVAFSPDGKTLASGSCKIRESSCAEGEVILWDISTALNTDVAIHKPIGEPLKGHTNGVTSVAFSPDGKTLASGSYDFTIILWDVTTRQPIGEPLKEHKNYVTSVTFSPDGKTFASGSQDGTIILWNMDTNTVPGVSIQSPATGHTGNVTSVAFSPDSKTLVSGSEDNTIILWDATTHQPIGEPLKGHTYGVTSVTFSPDGKILASGSEDSTIILWDATTRQPIGESLKGHTNGVTSVAFSPDGKILASASKDDMIILWNVTTHQPIGQPLRGHTYDVTSVAFSPDGKTLASGSEDQTIILWDVATHQPIRSLLTSWWYTHKVTTYISVAFSPDGKALAWGGCGKYEHYSCIEGGTILWDVAMGQPIGELIKGHTNIVTSVAFSSDGKTLASGSGDNTIILWDEETHQPIGEPIKGHTVAFSPDGKTLASGSGDNSVMFWDISTHQLLGRHVRSIDSVALSTDGTLMASGGADGNVILWDAAARQPIGEPLKGHTSNVTTVAFSPDGKILASGSYDDTIILWDVAMGQPIGEPLKGDKGKGFLHSLVFSPDGKTLASADSSIIILWDVATHQPLGEPLKDYVNVTSVAFSPDGKTLVSERFDNTIILWDIATHQPIGKPLKVDTSLPPGAFSPDGKTLASTEGGGIILWDVVTRQPFAEPLKGHTYGVTSMVFSPDGKSLVSVSLDGNIIFWPASPQAWIELSCQRAGRNFTRGEWAQYFPDEKYRATCPQWLLGPEPTATSTP